MSTSTWDWNDFFAVTCILGIFFMFTSSMSEGCQNDKERALARTESELSKELECSEQCPSSYTYNSGTCLCAE